jgi:putative IMPACT (imprinted ancient) family translation regulator
MSDNREPAGTAGRPALAVLRGADLGDVALVITRHFGGTKLGTGGLVRAYSDAARAALEALPRAQRIETCRVRIVAPYSFYERLLGLIAAHQGEITGEDFAAEVTLDAALPLDRLDEFRAALREASSGRIDLDLSAPTR